MSKKKKEELIQKKAQEEQEILNKVVSRVELFEGFISSKKTDWQRWWRLYRAQLDKPDGQTG